ncbi:hypothetical protein [uncultured Algibacter sp.]|uniref:hypothetical protein n=1 Tax=uncultured Algibacter sp. TaxID=298659 RepID=UPI0030EF0E0F|tara:strand:+ start:1873 stop:2268 length:396 start_codon:yes stop_codon:yes gene_type:complete
MEINFQCIELTIQDEELGCTVIFSDSRSADDQYKTDEEIMNSVEKYLLIQKTYAEDEYEYDTECYHLESSESNESFDPFGKININVTKEKLEVNLIGEKVIIGLNLKKQELEKLLRILETKFHEKITVNKK